MTRPAERHAPIARRRFVQHARAIVRGWFGGRAQPSADRTDAAKVRQMAYACSRTDPGFAADLHAAAARCEGSGSD